MAKYHITIKGEPGVCRASKNPCPLGGESEHYASKEEARNAYEARMADESSNTAKSQRLAETLRKQKQLATESKRVDKAWAVLSNTNDPNDAIAMSAAWEEVKDLPQFRGYSGTEDFYDTHDMFDALAVAHSDIRIEEDSLKDEEYAIRESFGEGE